MRSDSPGSERVLAARSVVPLFEPRRLQLAREIRGWSQRDLASRAHVTPAAISQFEGDGARPSATTLSSIAHAVGFPVTFFARAAHDPPSDLSAFFRSLRSTPTKDRRRAEGWTRILWVLTRTLEASVRLPDVRVPRVRTRLAATREDVESIASSVRDEWQLGTGPIENVVYELERRGIVAARLPAVSDKVDAFSVAFPTRPVVILGMESVRDRGRFNAAHELGHLVMHEPANAGDKRLEEQAHWFAASFLMPANTIRPELPSRVDWRTLLELKSRWGVSISALLMRARDLKRISAAEYVQAMKYMSARAWRRTEPGDLGPAESPVLLGRAVDLAKRNGVGLRDLAIQASLAEKDVRALIGQTVDSRPSLEL